MTHQFKYSDEELNELIRLYCNDFTAGAEEGRYDPITGRDEEIDQAVLVLLQKGRKNVCFQAPAGVGKTAAVVGLAQTIVSGKVPDYLKGAKVLEVDMASMAAGTTGPAEFQGRFMPLLQGMSERYRFDEYPKYIIFIDEVHTIMPTCHGSSYAGVSEVLKPYMTVGDLHVIGATTLDEYRMYLAQDPAMDRRFQKIFLSVPTVDETVEIMKNLRPGLEKHHRIKISDEALVRVVKLTERYLRKRNQPDKSIIMLDAACALHVKNIGPEEQTLNLKCINFMVSKECGIHADALDEEVDIGDH